jgi:hypothetical protein
MADASIHDPAPLVAPSINDEDSGNDSGVESIAMATSSLARGAAKMVYGEILELADFFKKTTVTEDDHKAYHDRIWLAGKPTFLHPRGRCPYH